MQNNIVKPNQSVVDLLEDLPFNQSLEDWQNLLKELLVSNFSQKNSVQHTTIEISNKLHQVHYLCRFIRQLKAQIQISTENVSALAVAVNEFDFDSFEENIFSGLSYWIHNDGIGEFTIEDLLNIALSYQSAEHIITECFSLYSNISG